MQIPVETEGGVQIMQLEEIASGWGITRRAQRWAERQLSQGRTAWAVTERAGGDPQAITARHVAEAAGAGDERASQILDRAREALAFALRQAIALVAPRRIILGGGVSLIGDNLWFAPIRRLVDAEVFGPFRGSYDIVPPVLGEEVVVHGALALAHDVAFKAG
jgi:glucokinase